MLSLISEITSYVNTFFSFLIFVVKFKLDSNFILLSEEFRG